MDDIQTNFQKEVERRIATTLFENYINVVKTFTFNAAHQLPNYDGDCANLHGHTYKLEVGCAGLVDKDTGMVIEFKLLEGIVKQHVLDLFDHSYLNEFMANPTAENLVGYIVFTLERELRQHRVVLTMVRLWETPTSCAEWGI